MRPSFVHRALVDAARDELQPQGVVDAAASERSALLRRARDHGMQGLVASAIRRTSSLEPWAMPFVEQAIGVREGHLQHVRTLKTAAQALDGDAVPRMVLKGPSLVERYYDDDSVRPYGDVDLLVPADRFGEALDALEEGGFTLLDRNWHLLRRDLRGQLHLRSPERDVLELHWHPVNSSRVRKVLSMGSGDLWEGAERAHVAGADVSVPRRSRELAYLCQHAAMHGCDRLIWLVDIRRVLAAADLDLDDLERTARRWRFGIGTYLVLALVDRWLGPIDRLHELRRIRPDRATLRAFEGLVTRWDLGHPRADTRFRQLLFATAADGAGRRAGLAWSLVVPPDVSDPERSTPMLEHVQRITLGAASRVRHKFDEHAGDRPPLEYRATGDPAKDRARYLRSVSLSGAGT